MVNNLCASKRFLTQFCHQNSIVLLIYLNLGSTYACCFFLMHAVTFLWLIRLIIEIRTQLIANNTKLLPIITKDLYYNSVWCMTHSMSQRTFNLIFYCCFLDNIRRLLSSTERRRIFWFWCCGVDLASEIFHTWH